jgi:hypothetical protein
VGVEEGGGETASSSPDVGDGDASSGGDTHTAKDAAEEVLTAREGGAAAAAAAADESTDHQSSVDDDDASADAGTEGGSKQHVKKEKGKVRNLFRRVRGLQALTEDELAETLARKHAERDVKREEKEAARAAKLALKAEKKNGKAANATKKGFPMATRIKTLVASKTKKNDEKQQQAGAAKKPKKRRKNPDEAYEVLRGAFDKEKLRAFFKRRPGQIAARLAAVLRVGRVGTLHHVVALQVEFERQILKPVFHLIGFRLWV